MSKPRKPNKKANGPSVIKRVRTGGVTYRIEKMANGRLVFTFKTEKDLFAYLQHAAPIEIIDAVIANIEDRIQERKSFYFKKRNPLDAFMDVWDEFDTPSQKNYDEMIDRITEDSWWDTGDQMRLAILRQIRRERMAQEKRSA